MNRKVLSVLVCLLVGMALLASSVLGCAAKPTEKIVMKAISASPVDSFNVFQYQRFINMVNEQAEGELYIDFLGGTEVIAFLSNRRQSGLARSICASTIRPFTKRWYRQP